MKVSAPKWAAGGASALILAIATTLGMHYEGTRRQAYADVAGVWTICQGHTAGVKRGDTATAAECRAYLQQDMGEAYAAVQRCITAPLTIGQAAAFTDAAYNLGPSIVCGSTLQKLANAGDVLGACAELSRWNKAAGKPVQGLINRRADEYALCVGGVR